MYSTLSLISIVSDRQLVTVLNNATAALDEMELGLVNVCEHEHGLAQFSVDAILSEMVRRIERRGMTNVSSDATGYP